MQPHAGRAQSSRPLFVAPSEGRRPANKRIMDVEDVLTWTYREELPKRHEDDGGGAAAISPMFRLCAFGGKVDN